MQGLAVLVIVFSIVFGIMAVFVPFFVFRIRNETIDINRRLQIIIDLMRQERLQQPPVIK